MGAATWLGVAVVVLVVAIVLVVAVVLVRALRRGRPTPVAEPERDSWEDALLADSAAPRPVPGQPTAAPAAGPEVLQRDALVQRDRAFDPAGWDDRPDGVEGTDQGLLGGDGS